jgi:tetratricopeptide (TPR) repeat protein
MLTRTIALKDDFAEAYQLRGETLLKMNDAKGADEDAQWLLNHVREDEDVLLLKARIEHAKHNLDEAIAYYDKVVSVNPFCIPAFRERGAVKLEKGDKAGAEVDAQQLLELNPQEAEGVNGNFEAKGTENIQQKMEEMYKNNNPYGF